VSYTRAHMHAQLSNMAHFHFICFYACLLSAFMSFSFLPSLFIFSPSSFFYSSISSFISPSRIFLPSYPRSFLLRRWIFPRIMSPFLPRCFPILSCSPFFLYIFSETFLDFGLKRKYAAVCYPSLR
jgi:hypothetical protein